jgi:hypothetical protein
MTLYYYMCRSWQDCCRRGKNRSWPSVSVESVDSECWCLNNANFLVYIMLLLLPAENRKSLSALTMGPISLLLNGYAGTFLKRKRTEAVVIFSPSLCRDANTFWYTFVVSQRSIRSESREKNSSVKPTNTGSKKLKVNMIIRLFCHSAPFAVNHGRKTLVSSLQTRGKKKLKVNMSIGWHYRVISN